MDTIRAFIAVEIDNQTKQKISGLISSLRKSDADVKWVTEDKMHLTLKFLGNTGQDKIQEISDALGRIANDTPSFAIHLSKVGAFPSMSQPRVIWIGIDKGAEFLKTLNEKIETALEKLGFAQESRRFEPHLTLARARSNKNMRDLAKLIEETGFDSGDDIKIDKLTLFRSSLNPKGAVYFILLQKYLQDI